MDGTFSESEDALSIINHPAVTLPGPSLLHLLVQREGQSNAPAIDFLAADGTRKSLSYSELHHASDSLAERISCLAEGRVGSARHIVPVLMPQSPELYVALLAVLKSGGAFCPLNLDVPLERAKFILDDVSATIIVTTTELAARIPSGDGSRTLLILDDARSMPEPQPVRISRQPEPEDLAYVMYTSGSTGTPKGVGISHRAATQSLHAHHRHIPPFLRFLQFAAPTFDVSVFEIFFPLYRGNTLVCCARSSMLNDLPAVIRDMRVDACELTPTVAGSLLRKRDNAPNLRLLLTIGEMLTEPVVKEFGGSEERASILWAMYGPTEAAIHCTLQPAFACDSSINNIGIPLDSVSSFILEILEDSNSSEFQFRVLPLGEIGELAVGGHQLADGYLNRPEQTAGAFIDTTYGRLYRTGDKARISRDGSLECFGRITDGQVKLRGQRIELGEVEHAALRAPGCHSAFAAVISSILVLFCALDGDDGALLTIQQSCKAWLPGFMVPGDIVLSSEFPRLASGKIDRKKLVSDYSDIRETKKPSTICFKDELEQRICSLAAEVLETDLDPNQSLSSAGMDSIVSIKFASVLRTAGFEVGAIDIMSSRTLSALHSRILGIQKLIGTAAIGLSSWHNTTVSFSDILAEKPELQTHFDLDDVVSVFSCSPLQAAMLGQTAADSRAYCNWIELNFPDTHSEESIRSWVFGLAQRNEILRTGFVFYHGRFLQVVSRELKQSQVSVVHGPLPREFEMQKEDDFLQPFRVQISKCPNAAGRSTVLQLHHAVYDGWSMDMMLSDFETLSRGEQPKPRFQFQQVLAYHESELFQKHCNEAREFWAENLLGFQPATLPNLRPDTALTSAVRSAAICLDISPDSLKTRLRQIGCSPQTVFQAALTWIWSLMIGSEDVVLGSVTSGRTMPISGLEDIIGPCIATVPLRTNVSQIRTIKDLLCSIQAANRSALFHAMLPLSEVRKAAGIRSWQPLFDAMFVYQESLHSKSRDVSTIREVNHQDYLETKLLVEVEPGRDLFLCRLTFHADTFPDDQMALLNQSIRALVPYMLENLGSELSVLQRALPEKLLSIYNPNPTTYSGIPDLAKGVENIAASFPTKDALCFADLLSNGASKTRTISFHELNTTANKIAWHLQQCGLREGDVVAVILEKSILLYAGILATLKVGCAYLPLLPTTPIARVDEIVRHAGVRLCLVDTAAMQKLQEKVPCNILDLQSVGMEEYRRDENLNVSAEPSRPAYIIYTSGSTGVPKGVCITQLNIMSNLDVLSKIYPVKANSRLLQSCSQAFDVSVFEIFFAWTQGMCLCSATNDTLFEDLGTSISELNITHLSMTPTVASLVDPADVPGVEFLVTAGEAMTEAVARKWAKHLYQGYGPSETTNICSAKKMGPSQNIRHLGWSFGNTSTFVLFRDSINVVPFGCLGEFCFGGDQIAQGYVNMSDLTAAKFINHPTFGRLYRSGDIGRMLPDGSMVIVGRVDDQIKLRGQRIELGEINTAFKESDAVADSTTLFLRQAGLESAGQIVTFYVPKSRQGAQFRLLDSDDQLAKEIQSLFQLLVSRLPAYMIPSYIIPISAFPITASGKLNNTQLKQAVNETEREYLAFASAAVSYDEGETQPSIIEAQIIEIISALFGVNKSTIQRWTPLTTVGLDSISAIEVARQVRKTLDKRLPISAILQNPSVARLAQALSKTAVSNGPQATIPDSVTNEQARAITSRFRDCGKKVEQILPCTPLQEATLASSSSQRAYSNRMLFRVNEDVEKLKEAWVRACSRHGILRTCFVTTDDIQRPFMQVVLDFWQPPWHHLECAGNTVKELISKHGDTVSDPLDSMEPAVSFATVADGEVMYLSFICHHAMYDGVAIERLLYEVELLLSNFSLPPAPSYEPFLRESLFLPPSTDSFWTDHLTDFDPKLIAQLSEENVNPSSIAATYTAHISLSQVNETAKQLSVSLLSVVQSAWAIVLGCLLETNDVCFGNVVSGRSVSIDNIQELVAPCFNTIPIRMVLSNSLRNFDLMKAFQNLNPTLLQYQFTPLRRIQSLNPLRQSRRLFDTLLLLQQPSRPLDESIWTLERDEGSMDIPLVCEVLPDPRLDIFTVKIHAESHRFSKESVALIWDLFSYALRSCLDFPGSSTLVFGAIPPALREKLATLHLNFVDTKPQSPQPDAPESEWTVTEASVRSVLSDLSTHGFQTIQRQTTIYQLGLDSISAVQVAWLLRNRGHKVLATDVLANPTCESLAHFLESQVGTLPHETISAYDISRFTRRVQSQVEAHVQLESIEAVLPCTPLQEAMMAQFTKSGGRDYFNHIDFRVLDTINVTSLAGAWRAMSLVHPILRTGFIPVEHEECAFAMVQYRPDSLSEPVTVVPRQLSKSFHVNKWRLDASHSVYQTPHKQPWRVAIVDTEVAVMMHLAIHHSLYDAHSLQQLLGDFASLVKGGQTPKPNSTDVAVMDVLGQVSASIESSEAFWRGQAGNVVINSFPVMTPLCVTPGNILVESLYSSIPFTVIDQAVAKAGYSFQVVLQAAWTRVLSSYLGEASVVFGVVFSGRTTEATRDAVFPCITTLPVVSKNTRSNRNLLDQMLQHNTGLHTQHHKPLARIQQWLGCSDARLFDTLLVYQKLDIDGGDTRPWSIVNEQATVDYPVSIEVEPQIGDRLKYQITVSDDVLPKEQARMLLEQFDATVRQLSLKPDASEEDLIDVSPSLFSITPAEIPKLPSAVKLLHHFVEAQALVTPHKTALHFVDGFDESAPVGREWTYDELNLNGNRVAQMLRPHVKVGDIVAIHFDKCPEAFFSILGILKSGCAFVALDPGAPPARKEFIVKDSGASILLMSSFGLDGLGFCGSVPVVSINHDSLSEQSCDSPLTIRGIEPSDVCYCLYTSGTTGTPKGCEITHDNAVQCMLAFQEIFKGRWDQDSRWLQFASLHFDVSVLEQYWSWSVGITVVSAPRDLILEDLAGTISRLNITHIDLTPSLARLVHPDDVPSLCRGVFITGGESLKQEILEFWGSKAIIYNFYGPTEATIGVTVYPRVPENGRPSNIGKQFINVGTYVMKPGTEQPVMRGAVGELCVSGRLVGKGYLNRDHLTAERFPTLERFGERIYRTGDLVRVLHDNCFDFLGRVDDQVKLRGQRLEIGEINHVIRSGVKEAKDVVTMVMRNEKHQKDLLVSFIVAEGKNKHQSSVSLHVIQGPSASDLCQRTLYACRSALPGYMVPTYVLQVPFIPLSANNKAELKELRVLFNGLDQSQLVLPSSSAGEIPKKLSETGAKVAKALASMQSIDIGRVSPTSSIFELGVDSISVLRFSRLLKKEGLSEARPSVILRHPVVGDLAYALDVQETTPRTPAWVASAQQLIQACDHKHRMQICVELGIMPSQIEYMAPCSPLQQGMISRSITKGAYYNSFQFQLSRDMSMLRLREAWQKTVDDFTIMRTSFVGTADGYVQVALKYIALPWVELDISSTLERSPGDLLDQCRESWIERNRERLTRPWEILSFRLQDTGENLLVLHMFHGLYDANSLKLLLDHVATEYRALDDVLSEGTRRISNKPSFLEALCHGPLQNFNSCQDFWMEHLGPASLRPITLSPSDSSARPSICERTVPFEGLKALRVALGVSHQSLLQAAWVGVLARRLRTSPPIGIVTSGRAIELDGAERVMGPLFNTLPFYARINPETRARSTWLSLIKECHAFNMAVLCFQHVPLRDIQKWCSNGKPLFDTLFSFQIEDHTAALDCELWKEVQTDSNADYSLALEATLVSGEHLRLLLVAQTGTDISENLSSLMDELDYVLSAIAQSPESAIWPEEFEVTAVETEDTILNKQASNTNNSTDLAEAAQDFIWSEEATIIRNEIALLAETAAESVTETTSVFELGLDSIDVIRLSSRLKQHGVHVKPSQLMKAQTIVAILQVLQYGVGDGHSAVGGTGSYYDLLAVSEYIFGLGHDLGNVDALLPATPLQDSMVADMIHSNFQLYFNHDILEIGPLVDTSKLKSAWVTVIEGSPILRTTFLAVNSPVIDFAYCQVVNKRPMSYIAEIELDSLSDLTKLMDSATQRARKSGAGSDLLQVVLASVSGRKFLVLSIAHALYDGWSLSLIHQDVQAAYRGRYVPRPSYLSYLEEIVSPANTESSNFWSGFLDGATSTMLPEKSNAPGQEETVHRAEASSLLQISDVKSFCKRHSVTLQTIGQACWAALLATRTGLLDVAFGVVLSGRESELSETLNFPTMNTVTVRTVLHGTISSWLRYMQDNMSGIGQFQHFPLRKAQRLARHVNGPLFNSLFVYQKQSPNSRTGTEEDFMKSINGYSSVEYPVCVEMEASDSNLFWRVACDGKYVSEADVSRLLHQLDAVLGHILNSPEADVLGFFDQRVSVCGLPAVVRLTNEPSPEIKDDLTSEQEDEWSPVEDTIRSVLAEVSGVSAASILKTHTIYHLGLDSISAIKASSSLRNAGIAIGFRDMLKANSILDMAKHVLALTLVSIDTPSDEEVIPIEPDGLSQLSNSTSVSLALRRSLLDKSLIEEVLPTTPMQVHMLSAWQNSKGSVFFPEFTYSLAGALGIATIASAWDRLVAESPILRTTFVSTISSEFPILQIVVRPESVQQNAPAPSLPMWTSAPLPTPCQSYCLMTVKQQAGGEWLLHLKIHHALYDAVSLPALMNRFIVLCNGEVTNSKAQNFNSTWRKMLSNQLSPSNQVSREQFWTAYLSGAQPAILPLGLTLSDPQIPESRVSILERTAIENISRLKGVCGNNGISIQALFFAAYAVSLSSWVTEAGEPKPEEVVFGIYIANRAEIDEQNELPYPTLCLIPLRVRIPSDAGLVKLASSIQEDLHSISSPNIAAVGLWEVKEWTGVMVHSFVNFLSLPAGHHAPNTIQLTALEPGGAGAAAREQLKYAEPPELTGNTAKYSYPDAVDVEASVTGDSMAIGVFGPNRMLSDGRAQHVVKSIAELLSSI
ncbi:hypothetical protein B0T26DRAFT_654462 [Lasiosphaeria miniovina]|uniref:Carrier domain-containing protein n=1 Tax=Lasiosphaeria miniovina TaxID=1954250 RepID=A0AA40A6U9_9PEZI|nr:uncharacterized protein B0T26DRAFT_654462 [Lasiosphaeria miniovina]KAK0710305.1 hypothetical protein B0T26DRAFT_654462 [Lasiosphaeria miniovina]